MPQVEGSLRGSDHTGLCMGTDPKVEGLVDAGCEHVGQPWRCSESCTFQWCHCQVLYVYVRYYLVVYTIVTMVFHDFVVGLC